MMKNLGIILTAVGCCHGIWLSAAVSAERLSVATFQVDVTPPIGSPLCHGSRKPAARIADPLQARGIVLIGADEPIVLCAVDWVGIGNEGNRVWRESLAQAVGTTPDRIAVHTVHQHDAPACDFSVEALLAEHDLGGQVFNVAFAREAIARTAAAARRSLESAVRIAHVGIGQADVDRVASTRRVLGPDSKVKYVRYATSTRPEAAEDPEGTIDPVLRQVSLWDGERAVVVLTYYACHPVTVYGQGAVSADIAGLARGLRDFYAPDVLHIYFAGAGGDLTCGKYNQGRPQQRLELAGRLADAMEQAFKSVRKHPVTTADVEWRVRPTTLPLRKGLEEADQMQVLRDPAGTYVDRLRAARNLVWIRRHLNDDAAIDFTCLRIGPAWIVHLPGESFVEYQLAAVGMRPDDLVCVAAYGEYGTGYIGTAAAYDQGGYEVGPVSRVGPDADPVMLAAIRELLK
ncbi:MAG TPA: hypothetical protein VLM89_07135 [Phycisphaerae bacterium]|nr:hypothetical protein [Phycisphaerae bacterium]